MAEFDFDEGDIVVEQGPVGDVEITKEEAVAIVTDSIDEIAADLEDRRTFIGGSDAAAVLGVSPWTSRVELWKQKTGKMPVADLSDVERVVAGQIIEESIAKLYAWKYGRKLRRINERVIYKDAPYPCVAQIDRKLEGERVVIELKNADVSQRKKWGEDGSGDIPLYYYTQVEHQLMVTNYERAEAVPLFGGNTLGRYFLGYDADFIADLMEAEYLFWQCVKNDTPPEPLTPSECRLLWTEPEAVRVPAEAIAAQLVGFMEARAGAIKGIQAEIDAAQVILMRQLQCKGDTLVVDGKPVCTWKPETRGDFDEAAFKKANPELFAFYSKSNTSRVFRKSKAGKEAVVDFALVAETIAPILSITAGISGEGDEE